MHGKSNIKYLSHSLPQLTNRGLSSRWGQQTSLKFQQLLTKQHGVISKDIWIFITEAMSASGLVLWVSCDHQISKWHTYRQQYCFCFQGDGTTGTQLVCTCCLTTCVVVNCFRTCGMPGGSALALVRSLLILSYDQFKHYSGTFSLIY